MRVVTNQNSNKTHAMKNIILTIVTFLVFVSSVFAQKGDQIDFYKAGAMKAGKTALAGAYDALKANNLTPEHRKVLERELASFRKRKMERDAAFLESKLGVSPASVSASDAPKKPKITPPSKPKNLQVPDLEEPREVAHSDREAGWEDERIGGFNLRTALEYQARQWNELRDNVVGDDDKKSAFASYASAYDTALKAFKGGAVTDDERRTYGPILDHFEKEAIERGKSENAKAIKLAIERGQFLRSLETPSFDSVPDVKVTSEVLPSATQAVPAPGTTTTTTQTTVVPAGSQPATGHSTPFTPPNVPGVTEPLPAPRVVKETPLPPRSTTRKK